MSPRDSFPSRQPQIDRENIKATIKWFNPSKGFGFVSPADGGEDIFLHASALAGFSPEMLEEGATILCDIGRGQKGPQVVAVHEIDPSTATPGGGGGGGQPRDRGGFDRPPRRDGPPPRRDSFGGGRDSYGGGRDSFGGGGRDSYGGGGGRDSGPSGPSVQTTGAVKFFNDSKGFGFVSREDGGDDAFLHASVLERSRLGPPAEGQRVKMSLKQGQRGWQVDSIEYI